MLPFPPEGFICSIGRQRVEQETGTRVSKASCSFTSTAAEDWCEEVCVHVYAHFSRSHASSVRVWKRAGRYFQVKPPFARRWRKAISMVPFFGWLVGFSFGFTFYWWFSALMWNVACPLISSLSAVTLSPVVLIPVQGSSLALKFSEAGCMKKSASSFSLKGNNLWNTKKIQGTSAHSISSLFVHQWMILLCHPYIKWRVGLNDPWGPSQSGILWICENNRRLINIFLEQEWSSLAFAFLPLSSRASINCTSAGIIQLPPRNIPYEGRNSSSFSKTFMICKGMFYVKCISNAEGLKFYF